jgi:glycosyltransferase involved in cell wall biosynthesis
VRVLFLNPGGSLGGAERCLLDLAASMAAHKGSGGITLGLVAGGDGPLATEAEALGMAVFRLPLSERLAAVGDSALVAGGANAMFAFTQRLARAGVDAPGYGYKLRKIIRTFAPSVVHSNGIKMHLLAAAVRGSEPLVWHIRDFIGDRPLVSWATRVAAVRASGAIAISNAVADDVRRLMPGLPVFVVHDAIDTDLFCPTGPVADLDSMGRAERSPPGTLRVGLVATYARWKGHEIFLKAVRRMKSMTGVPALRFYVVGGPIYETAASQYDEGELRSIVDQLGIADRVTFVPFQRQVERVYRALDIVVHASSRQEPFGRTIAEAMSTGRAVVVSRGAGAAEVFVNGVDAIETPARDPEALAEALHGLVLSADRREELGKAARVAAVERFSRARLAEQVFRIYSSVGGNDVRVASHTDPLVTPALTAEARGRKNA